MTIATDLHIHSTLSPCASLEMSPAAIVRRARELALDLIAVTDHNSVENGFTAARLGEKIGLKVVFGMEAQTREDVHVLCLFEDRRQAERFNERVYALLPDVGNNPELFGDQVVVDEQDNIVRQEGKLLLNALDISVAGPARTGQGARRHRHPRPCRGAALRLAGQPGHGAGRARRRAAGDRLRVVAAGRAARVPRPRPPPLAAQLRRPLPARISGGRARSSRRRPPPCRRCWRRRARARSRSFPRGPMVEDLCFHLLDLVQNSVAAGARTIRLAISESGSPATA